MTSVCKISLTKSKPKFTPGEDIEGQFHCLFTEPSNITKVSVELNCIESVEFELWTGTCGTNYKTFSDSRTILHESLELFSSTDGSEASPCTDCNFPFIFKLLEGPSTFNSFDGNVTYTLSGKVLSKESGTSSAEVPILVESSVDFKSLPVENWAPVLLSRQKFVGICRRKILASIIVPRRIFLLGEEVVVRTEVSNKSRRNIDLITFKVTRTIIFTAGDESKDCRSELLTVCEEGVLPKSERVFNTKIFISPEIEVPNFAKCELLEASYEMLVTLVLPGFALDIDFDLDILLVRK